MKEKSQSEEILQDIYNKRDITEKHLEYNQWLKLYSLRIAKEKEKQYLNNRFKKHYLKLNDPCTIEVYINGKYENIGGIVSGIDKTGYYIVTTKSATFNSSQYRHIWKRNKEDFSMIEIPNVLKKLSTIRLLKILKKYRRMHYGYDLYTNGDCNTPNINVDIIINCTECNYYQIKAELSKREHIIKSYEKEYLKLKK
jgi:hypothetical protein